jgi:hypothetical protein
LTSLRTVNGIALMSTVVSCCFALLRRVMVFEKNKHTS